MINQQLGLVPVAQMPISSQISGNCSWANVQAIVPVAYAMQELKKVDILILMWLCGFYDEWVEWDKDRALDECIQRFYLASPLRKASIAAMLGAVLFQTCDHGTGIMLNGQRKFCSIMTLPEYYYILQSYLEEYCIKRLTEKVIIYLNC